MMSSRAALSAKVSAAGTRRHTILTAAAVVIAGSLASPASAADFPLLSSSPISYYRWEGGYVGAHLGYALGESDFGLTGFPAASFAGAIPPIPTASSAKTNGFVGGFQAGYLHQIDAFVFGVEGDFILTSASGLASSSGGTPIGLGYGLREQQEVPWISTLRGRIGYAPNDRYMIYASGGLALAAVKTTSDLTFSNGLEFRGLARRHPPRLGRRRRRRVRDLAVDLRHARLPAFRSRPRHGGRTAERGRETSRPIPAPHCAATSCASA